MDSPTIRRALLSVSDKMGLADFARALASAGVEIFSTGGTRRHLESAGIAVRDVSAYTGFPEMMDGRLKTLHPKIFGGILCRHNRPDDMQTVDAHGIAAFELVVVNLYPFETTVARADVSRDEAIENVDIGGPSLVRAAAKNHDFVTVCTHPDQYAAVLQEVQQQGRTTLKLRRELAAQAFTRTAAYDRAIADYFTGETCDGAFPSSLNLALHRKAVLRYGENPHQQAAIYHTVGFRGPSLASATQLNGKELSYNNLLDLDSALAIARSLPAAAAVVIKHNNPCGAAVDESLRLAAEKAMAGDPVSAFGSVLGFNTTVDQETAEFLSRPGFFVEAIVAPDFDAAAVGVLTSVPRWKTNVRLLRVGLLDQPPAVQQVRYLEGGMLIQNADAGHDPQDAWRVVTQKCPTDQQLAELNFAWSMVRHVKSNAIVLSRERALCGVGAGQMSRIDSVDIAIRKAAERAAGSVLSSDAFFPFADSIHRAADAGVSAIIQPGGSKKDDEVIAACNERSLPMVFTGIRHFRH